MVVVVILSVVVTLAVIGFALYEHFKLDSAQSSIKTLKSQLDFQRETLDMTLNQLNDLAAVNEAKESRINELTSQLHQLEIDATRDEGTAELVDQQENTLKHLNESIETSRSELDGLHKNRTALIDELERIKIQRHELEDIVKEREAAAKAMEMDVNNLDGSIKELKRRYEMIQNELIDKLSLQKKVYSDVGDVGSMLSLNGREERLVNALNDISLNYPDLSSDLATLAWRKVWLPKMQSIARNWSGISGIYKLTLLKDEKVCYIGQAVDIKERWYTHAKKMIGADPSGNEKLYGGGWMPSDFEWSVVEAVTNGQYVGFNGLVVKVDDLKSWLNERERYWIEWYGCVEVGLNGK